MTIDLETARKAFEHALKLDPRDGLTVKAAVEAESLRVEVRHQDVDEKRGFDVVAQPLESEDRSAEELGRAVAEVVERELAYGQLPACGEDGQYKHVTV